jgi:tetratricopeptide (TPR) repeat protein
MKIWLRPLVLGVVLLTIEKPVEARASGSDFFLKTEDQKKNFPLTPQGHQDLIEAAKKGDQWAQDEVMRRFAFDMLDGLSQKEIPWFLGQCVEKVAYKDGYRKAFFKFFNGEEEKKESVIEAIEKGSLQKHPMALFQKGALYTNGEGGVVSFGKAKECFEQAEELGSAEAARALGTFYFYAKGVGLDYPKGVNYFTKAAQKNDPIAQYYLGYYFSQKGDYDQALAYYQKSAEQGLLRAQKDLESLQNVQLFMQKKADEGNPKKELQLNKTELLNLNIDKLQEEFSGLTQKIQKSPKYFAKDGKTYFALPHLAEACQIFPSYLKQVPFSQDFPPETLVAETFFVLSTYQDLYRLQQGIIQEVARMTYNQWKQRRPAIEKLFKDGTENFQKSLEQKASILCIHQVDTMPDEAPIVFGLAFENQG